MSNRRVGSRVAAGVVCGWIAMAGPATAASDTSWLSDVIISSFTNVIVSSAVAPSPPRLALGQDAAGRVFVESRSPGGAVQRGWLGAVAPIGAASARAIVDGTSNTILAFHGDGDFVDLYALGRLEPGTPLAPVRLASVSVSRDFDPDSMRLGIIAILIGLAKGPQPVPVLSFTDGPTHRVLVWNGSALLPFIEQDS